MKVLNFIKRHKKVIWWTILFSCSMIYIFFNSSKIINQPNDIDKSVVIIFIILAFLPLVQEISFAGLSIKREIESVKDELKSEVQKVKFEIMQFSFNNSMRSDIKIDIGNEVLPSKEIIRQDLLLANEKRSLQSNNKYETVSDNVMELFKARYIIEQNINTIASKYDIELRRGLKATTKSLLNAKLINRRTYEYINKVLPICNRGIHGEILDEYYIDYVRKIFPEIVHGFSEITNTFHTCAECGFPRISDFELKCPECGAILTEFQ